MLPKRNIIILVLIAIAVFAGSAYSAGPPVAVVSEPVFEHPPVVEEDTVLHEFRIQNTGGSELRIPKVKTD